MSRHIQTFKGTRNDRQAHIREDQRNGVFVIDCTEHGRSVQVCRVDLDEGFSEAAGIALAWTGPELVDNSKPTPSALRAEYPRKPSHALRGKR